jgi:RNA polymerase sigma-70 factor (ECF subfamily)
MLCYGAIGLSVKAKERGWIRPVECEYVELVDRHRDELRNHARRILRSPDDAEDALQEALMKAWRALPRFQGRGSLRSWLYRIVTNTSLDEIHRRPRRVVPIDLEGTPSATHWHGEATAGAAEGNYLTREDFERALIVTMRLLPPRQRAVLILREALGFSARETANAGHQRAGGEQLAATRSCPTRGTGRRLKRSDGTLARGRPTAKAR